MSAQLSAPLSQRESRPFRVHARDAACGHVRLVEEATFEAAAISYVEQYCPAMADEAEIAVVVQDVRDGREHCFRIDIGAGDAAPCETASGS